MGRWALHFALTQAVELPIDGVGLRPLPRWKRYAVGFGANALTHPWLWFVLPPLLQRRLGYAGYLALVEPLIAVVEALCFTAVGVAPRRALAVAALANAASFGAGVLLHLLWSR